MFPTLCILNRQQPWECTSHGCFGYGAVRLLCPRHQCDCAWQKNRPRESRGCHQQVVAIPEWRRMAFLLQSAICSALLKSLLAALKRSTNLDRQVSHRILVLRQQSCRLLLSKPPPGVSPGRAWNRHYGLRIYCCKLVDSAASCSTWAA